MAEDDEDDAGDAISLIEARLEYLAGVAERCRKIIVASKAAIAVGSGTGAKSTPRKAVLVPAVARVVNELAGNVDVESVSLMVTSLPSVVMP